MLEINLLFRFYFWLVVSIHTLVQCVQNQGTYSYDSRSHISSDIIRRKYVSNHTAIYNHHLIPYVIDEIPGQTCGMLYITSFCENFTLHKKNEYDAHQGVVLKPRHTKDPPIFEWYDGDERDYYTVMMFDIDYPNATHPVERNWLNYLVVNSRGYRKVPKSKQLAEYIGPWPLNGTGLHRYVGLVYMQPKKLTFREKKIKEYDFLTRANFNHRAFATKYNLGKPVCVNFFMAEWEEFVDKEYKDFYSRHPSYFSTKEILKDADVSDSFMYLDIPNGTEPKF